MLLTTPFQDWYGILFVASSSFEPCRYNFTSRRSTFSCSLTMSPTHSTTPSAAPQLLTSVPLYNPCPVLRRYHHSQPREFDKVAIKRLTTRLETLFPRHQSDTSSLATATCISAQRLTPARSTDFAGDSVSDLLISRKLWLTTRLDHSDGISMAGT